MDDQQRVDREGHGEEFRAGGLAILPAVVASAPFGLLLGALAAQKGLTVAEIVLMSGLVFAGSAQFVAVELWREPAAWAALGATAFLVNVRHVLMGASLSRRMAAFTPGAAHAGLFFLADEIWAMAERRAATARLTPAFYAGMAVVLYLNWLAWTGLGAAFGSLIGDPTRFGFDFAFTAIFIGLIAGLSRGPASLVVVAASGTASVVAYLALPSPWHIVIGGLAGMAAGAVLYRRAA